MARYRTGMSRFSSLRRHALLACATLAISSFTLGAAESTGLNALQGTWEGRRNGEDGTEQKQVLEIQGDTLKFSLFKSDGELRLFAKGKTKVEKLGNIQILRLTDIQAGVTESDLQSIDDDRSTPFLISEDTLSLANNFDKDRENQKPRVDVYRLKARPAADSSSNSKLIGTWKITAKIDDQESQHELQVTEVNGALQGLVKSEGLADKVLKTLRLENDKVTMEIVREIDGNDALVICTGALKDGTLSGSFTVKGQEDSIKGSWSAKR